MDDRELELSFTGQPAHFEADGDLDRDGSLTPRSVHPVPAGEGVRSVSDRRRPGEPSGRL